MSGLNGTKPTHAVTEVVRCRVCGMTRVVPAHRPRVWTFVCRGCNSTLEIELGE